MKNICFKFWLIGLTVLFSNVLSTDDNNINFTSYKLESNFIQSYLILKKVINNNTYEKITIYNLTENDSNICDYHWELNKNNEDIVCSSINEAKHDLNLKFKQFITLDDCLNFLLNDTNISTIKEYMIKSNTNYIVNELHNNNNVSFYEKEYMKLSDRLVNVEKFISEINIFLIDNNISTISHEATILGAVIYSLWFITLLLISVLLSFYDEFIKSYISIKYIKMS